MMEKAPIIKIMNTETTLSPEETFSLTNKAQGTKETKIMGMVSMQVENFPRMGILMLDMNIYYIILHRIRNRIIFLWKLELITTLIHQLINMLNLSKISSLSKNTSSIDKMLKMIIEGMGKIIISHHSIMMVKKVSKRVCIKKIINHI